MLVNLDCPVELRDYKLYRSKSTGDIYCSLIFNNLSDKVVKAIKAKLYCYDQLGTLIEKENYSEAKVEYSQGLYPNIKSETDDKLCLHKDTRKIEIDVESILFKDSTTWEKGSTRLEEVELHAIRDKNILNYLGKYVGSDAIYLSKNHNNKWSCICGRFNYQDQLTCKRCGRNKEVVLEKYSSKDVLYDEMKRVEAQEEEREKHWRKEQEKQAIIKKHRNKRIIKLISVITLIVVVLGTFAFGYITKYTFSWDNYLLLRDKNNALIESVKAEDNQKVEFLITNNANPNFMNNKGENAIAEAIKLGNKETVTSLLNKNTDSIVVGKDKESIAHLAVKQDQLNILKEIEKSGFDMNISNESGETVLYLAIEKDNRDIINYLTQEADVDLQAIDNRRNNALQVALLLQAENMEIIKSLLDLNIKLETENDDGDSTYKSAIISENIDVVKEFIIKEELDLNNIDEKSNNALHIYLNTKKNDKQYVQDLITEGTDVNGFNAEGYSPLYFAIKNAKTSLIEELLQNEANINKVTEDGKTALDVLDENGGNKNIEFFINEYSDKKIVYEDVDSKNNEKEDESSATPPEETSENTTNKVVISYQITQEGLVDIDSGFLDINIKVGDTIRLDPSYAEGTTDRILMDGVLMEPLEPTLIRAFQQGVGYITIIPDVYDWDNSVDINVVID